VSPRIHELDLEDALHLEQRKFIANSLENCLIQIFNSDVIFNENYAPILQRVRL